LRLSGKAVCFLILDIYMAKYSNVRAMRALVIASLQGIFKSPSAVFFAFAFPMVFILVFGTMGNGSSFHISVAAAPGSDTSSSLYAILHQVPVLKWVSKDTPAINKMLREGDIVATLDIKKQPAGTKPEYNILINAASSEMDKAEQLKNILADVVSQMDPDVQRKKAELVAVEVREAKVRDYKTIDFILPGQLSFSLLASAVFGTAFVFFNLRQTLVLKRFFATPVRKEIIVISEGIARMLFQLLSVIVIIGVGYYVFGFTLYNGWVTFLNIFLMSAISVLIFMGFGFIVSGLAKSDASIPIFSNLIVMPQMLLSGTFFSIDNFPRWMQPFCRALPLSYLNDALRKISFDGANLWAIKMDIAALLVWGIIIYAAAIKTFKWE
jgi:ABC-2 type transport system permease protein